MEQLPLGQHIVRHHVRQNRPRAAAPGWYPDPLEQHASEYRTTGPTTSRVNPRARDPSPWRTRPLRPLRVHDTDAPAANRGAKRHAVMIAIGGGSWPGGARALLPWERVIGARATVQSVKGTSEGGGLCGAGSSHLPAFAASLNGTLRAAKQSIGTLIVCRWSALCSPGETSPTISIRHQPGEEHGGGLPQGRGGCQGVGSCWSSLAV